MTTPDPLREEFEVLANRLRQIANSLPNVADCDAPQVELRQIAKQLQAARASAPAAPTTTVKDSLMVAAPPPMAAEPSIPTADEYLKRAQGTASDAWRKGWEACRDCVMSTPRSALSAAPSANQGVTEPSVDSSASSGSHELPAGVAAGCAQEPVGTDRAANFRQAAKVAWVAMCQHMPDQKATHDFYAAITSDECDTTDLGSVRAALDEVRQMCRDYSLRDGCVYILDVLSTIDAIEQRHGEAA